MTKLSKVLPNINFYLHENQTDVLLQQLDEGKLDVLILSWLPTMQGIERYTLFNEPLVLASPDDHPLTQKEALTLKDLNGQWVLTLEDGHCLRDEALGYCFSAGAKEDTRFQATSLETLRYMVASGMGITLIPELAIKEGEHGLQYTHFKAPVPTREICLLVRPNYSRMECVRALVSSIKASMADYIK
jgi:LysR family hydrogen peroxide-inducible transcriptional activator